MQIVNITIIIEQKKRLPFKQTIQDSLPIDKESPYLPVFIS
jgi:hypothetical protein